PLARRPGRRRILCTVPRMRAIDSVAAPTYLAHRYLDKRGTGRSGSLRCRGLAGCGQAAALPRASGVVSPSGYHAAPAVPPLGRATRAPGRDGPRNLRETRAAEQMMPVRAVAVAGALVSIASEHAGADSRCAWLQAVPSAARARCISRPRGSPCSIPRRHGGLRPCGDEAPPGRTPCPARGCIDPGGVSWLHPEFGEPVS